MDLETVKGQLRGPAALVMAPFKADLSLDTAALAQNVRAIGDGGLRSGRGFMIVPCGTGEYVSLDRDEHRQMVETAVRATDGTVPVVAGVGTCDIREAIALSENAKQAGAIAVMCPPPFYYRLTHDFFVDWYRELTSATDIPIMVYDQSWRRELGTRIALPVMERLSSIPSIVSLKYGSPNVFMDMIDALEQFAGRYAFIDNSLGYTATVSHMHGATGFISGPSTWWPEFELKFWDLMESGAYQEADQWHAQITPYMHYHQNEEFEGEEHYFAAALIKACLEYVGLYGGPCRPPFRELSKSQKERLFITLDQMGVPSKTLAPA